MDRRSLILLIATFLLMLFWMPLMKRIYPDKPLPPGATNALVAASAAGASGTNAASGVSGAAGPSTVGASAGSVPPPAVAAGAAGTPRPGFADPGFHAPSGTATEVAIENDAMKVVLSSHGGGLRTVELKGHGDALKWQDVRAGKKAPNAVMNRWPPTPLMTVLGLEAPGAEPSYDVFLTNNAAVARRELGNGLRLVKEFRLLTNGHVVHVTARLQNWSDAARAVPAQEWVFGTAEPLHKDEQPLYRGFFDHNGSSAEHLTDAWFANRTLGCIPGTPRAEYLGAGTNVAWAAVHNQFFATIVEPKDRATRVYSRQIELPTAPAAPGAPHPAGFQTALLYGAENLPAQQERVREFDLYVGPKEYAALSKLGSNTDVVMGFDNYFGGRFSGFFARALLLAMQGLHSVGFSYGLAIIAITVIVRLLFWPLMAASARTSKRMAALQPQIKELQARYKDNPQKLNQKMMELWREHKVNPAAGCVPILIQFPILLGFYAMLQTAIELRGESFLWAFDLSQTDTIGMLPGLNFPINPLPLLMGATMLWQARLQPMSPGMDPAQQKIMKYMPLMFMVFLYSFSAGLTLYWTVSNLLSILQMKLTRAQEAKKGGAAPGATSGPPLAGRRPRGGGPAARPA
jgi:YidC/Oxa1 family membrane protein insertase